MKEQLVPLADVLRRADKALAAGSSAGPAPRPLGFSPLDHELGGGVRPGELVLLGGPQGLGKTTMALQMMCHVLRSGGSAVYFSFEHDEDVLLPRLLAIEAVDAAGMEAASLSELRDALSVAGPAGLSAALDAVPGGPEALDALRGYEKRLHIHRGSSERTDLVALRESVLKARADAPLVVVDYLQKVAVPDVLDEDEGTRRIVQSLKDLALEAGVPVLAIVAADRAGLAQSRLRIQHLRGSSAIAYEADVILLLNDKYQIVARHHLMYDVGNAERHRNWVVLSIEKNRSGRDHVDLEFAKDFERGRFDPMGQEVGEQLTDDRVFTE